MELLYSSILEPVTDSKGGAFREKLIVVHLVKFSTLNGTGSQDKSVFKRRASSWMIEGSSSDRGWGLLSSPPRTDRLWSPSSFLSSGYQGLLPWW